MSRLCRRADSITVALLVAVYKNEAINIWNHASTWLKAVKEPLLPWQVCGRPEVHKEPETSKCAGYALEVTCAVRKLWCSFPRSARLWRFSHHTEVSFYLDVICHLQHLKALRILTRSHWHIEMRLCFLLFIVCQVCHWFESDPIADSSPRRMEIQTGFDFY